MVSIHEELSPKPTKARGKIEPLLSLPEEYSSAEEEVYTDEDDCENLIKEDKVCKAGKMRETCSFTSSPAPPLTTHSILHGEEVDLSPRSIALLEAGEGAGKQGIEKLLLERLLARKELRLVAMQEKVELQNKRLKEVEARLAWLEAIPGISVFERLGSYLLKFGQRSWAPKADGVI